MGIQTDTVWTIDGYKGEAMEHDDMKCFRGLKIYGKDHETSADSCENVMEISAEAMYNLNGATVHCGSHMNHYQAKIIECSVLLWNNLPQI